MKYGLIRVVALGGNGLIRGRLLNSHTCQTYPSLHNGLYSNVHLQYKAWIINPWRYRLMRMNSQSLKIWADRYEFSIFEDMGWQVWILNFWRYGLRSMNLKIWAERYEFSFYEGMGDRYEFSIFESVNSQFLKVWADRYKFSIFEGMAWQVWILNLWRYGLTGMNLRSLKVWADRYEFSILKVPVDRYEFSKFEDVDRQVWILNIWRYGLTGMNTSIFEGMYWQVWILNFVGMAWQVGILNIWQVWRHYLDFFFQIKKCFIGRNFCTNLIWI